MRPSLQTESQILYCKPGPMLVDKKDISLMGK